MINNKNVIQKPFEAIVIGSGATGGIAALTLAELGIRVLVIEAGPELTAKQALGTEPCNTFRRIKRIVSGENRIQSQHPGFWKSNPLLYINEKENRYKTPSGKPFIWTQGRQVGGRSLTWGGITLRLSDSNFKAKSFDNYGPDWPINYSDLVPHYNAIEKLLNVKGNNDGLDQIPDGIFSEAMPFTPSEKIFKEEVEEKLKYKVIHSRGFGTQDKGKTEDWPKSSSLGSTLKKALLTGKVEILPNHIVERLILSNDQSVAEGLIGINSVTNNRIKIYSKLIILCASTIQSIKILLNSSESIHSKGLIEPSGKLGSFLMDHISTCRFFSLPIKSKDKSKRNELTGAGSFFIPFGNHPDNTTDINFIRGYGIWGAIDRFDPPTILKTMPDTKTGFLIGHGEVLAYEDNKLSLSKELDKWGLPIPHIDFTWKENELNMVSHMNKTIEKCVKASGGQIHPIQELIKIPLLKEIVNNSFALKSDPPPPGYYVHEVGGARMSNNSSQGVLDKWNRLWQCQNVLVVDGACWPTSAWQSPTLTMMAIARRACIEAIKNQST